MKRKPVAIPACASLLGDRLRELRTDRCLTQTELLKRIKSESVRLRLLGVFDLNSTSSYNMVWYLEAGFREPSFSEGILLCQVLGVPPESLLPYWTRVKLTYPYSQRVAYPEESQALQAIVFKLTEPPTPEQEKLKDALLRISRSSYVKPAAAIS